MHPFWGRQTARPGEFIAFMLVWRLMGLTSFLDGLPGSDLFRRSARLDRTNKWI
jgi:hypothetical protein